MAGGTIGQDQRGTGGMAVDAGRGHAASKRAVQVAAMAKGTGCTHLFCRFMAVGGHTSPQRNGVGRVGCMTLLATLGKVSDGHVEARVVPDTGIRRSGMTRYTTGQIILGIQSMLPWIGVRQGVCGARA